MHLYYSYHNYIMYIFLITITLLLSFSFSFASEYPELKIKIESVPRDWKITLTWEKPDKAHSVLLIRKEKGFPQSTRDGDTVYRGQGRKAVDKDLVADTEYFYRFFFFDSKGHIIGWSRHKEKT